MACQMECRLDKRCLLAKLRMFGINIRLTGANLKAMPHLEIGFYKKTSAECKGMMPCIFHRDV